MIRASHRFPFTSLVNFYLPYKLRKSFYSFFVTNSLPEWDKSQSLVITPNHFCYWDGFMIYFLRKKLFPPHYRGYVMVQEDQLERFWPLRYAGAFSVDLARPETIRTTLRYTAELLDQKNSLIALYPDGRLVPHDEMPHRLTKGISLLPAFTKNPFLILPVFFRITFWNQLKPEIWCRFGPVIQSDWIRPHFEEYENLFNVNLAKLDSDMRRRVSCPDLFRK